MTRKIWLTLGVIGIAVVLGLGVYHSDASQGEPTLTSDEIKELVNSQYPGKITELELAKDSNKAIYKVTVVNDGMEYALKLDGHSGEVIALKEIYVAEKDQSSTKETNDEKEKEVSDEEEKAAQEEAEKEQAEKEQEEIAQAEKAQEEKERAEEEQAEQEQRQQETKIAKKETEEKQEPKDKQDNQPKKKSTESKPKKKESEKKAVIDMNKAIEIALEQFPGVVDEVELEEEDGRLIYEVEIEGDGEEAEFQIDAYTGEIIVIEIEDD